MMKFLMVPALLISICTMAQKKADPSKYAKTITAEALKKKLTIIASTEMEGRETATPGQKKAAAFIEGYFKKIGLQPATPNGYQLKYPVFQDSLVETNFVINAASLTKKDFILNPVAYANGQWNAKNIVFVGFGIKDSMANINDFDGLDIKNKWVMVLDGSPADTSLKPATSNTTGRFSLRYKIADITSKGAAGMLMVCTKLDSVIAVKGNMYLTEKKADMPIVYISEGVASDILRSSLLLNNKNMSKLTHGVYPCNLSFKEKITTLHLESSNVLGLLPGTDKKDEYIFVTGHYDHLGKRGDVIYYGADDDGSGTTGVLQIATAFAKAKAAGNGPRRSMIFMTVSGEEKGLWGSEFYINHPVVPLENTSVDLNIDMIGRIDPSYKGDSTNYIFAIGEDKMSTELMKITDSINKKYMHMEVDRRYNDPKDPNRFYYRSDHYNFAKKGIPIIFYFNGVHPDYHRPTDTVDKINFPLMAKRAKLVFYTAWDMANKDAMLMRDIPLKPM